MLFQKLLVRGLIVWFGLLGFWANTVFGQENTKSGNDTIPDFFQSEKYLGGLNNNDFQVIINIYDRYFSKYPEMRERMEETYKHYQRWKYFWQPRMNKLGEKEAGPQYYNQMVLKRLRRFSAQGKTPASVCNQGNYNPNWQLLGPKKKYKDQNRGRLISVAVHPNDTNTIYAGSWQSGLYKTTDHGKHWENMTDSKRIPGLGVHDIAINPDDPDTVYIATGRNGRKTTTIYYGVGVWKSIDGGETWNPTGLTTRASQRYMTRNLLIDPNDPQTIYASRLDRLIRSKDGGAT